MVLDIPAWLWQASTTGHSTNPPTGTSPSTTGASTTSTDSHSASANPRTTMAAAGSANRNRLIGPLLDSNGDPFATPVEWWESGKLWEPKSPGTQPEAPAVVDECTTKPRGKVPDRPEGLPVISITRSAVLDKCALRPDDYVIGKDTDGNEMFTDPAKELFYQNYLTKYDETIPEHANHIEGKEECGWAKYWIEVDKCIAYRVYQKDLAKYNFDLCEWQKLNDDYQDVKDNHGNAKWKLTHKNSCIRRVNNANWRSEDWTKWIHPMDLETYFPNEATSNHRGTSKSPRVWANRYIRMLIDVLKEEPTESLFAHTCFDRSRGDSRPLENWITRFKNLIVMSIHGYTFGHGIRGNYSRYISLINMKNREMSTYDTAQPFMDLVVPFICGIIGDGTMTICLEEIMTTQFVSIQNNSNSTGKNRGIYSTAWVEEYAERANQIEEKEAEDGSAVSGIHLPQAVALTVLFPKITSRWERSNNKRKRDAKNGKNGGKDTGNLPTRMFLSRIKDETNLNQHNIVTNWINNGTWTEASTASTVPTDSEAANNNNATSDEIGENHIMDALFS